MPDKLPVKTNNYGGTVGGPIKHDKLFFFGSFEGYKRSQSLFTFFSVPDAALRAGDFSKALNTNGSVQQHLQPVHRQRQRRRARSSSRTTRFRRA